MTKFICKRCNYRFESNHNQENKKCPYCGRRELTKEPDAEELLKER